MCLRRRLASNGRDELQLPGYGCVEPKCSSPSSTCYCYRRRRRRRQCVCVCVCVCATAVVHVWAVCGGVCRCFTACACGRARARFVDLPSVVLAMLVIISY